LAPFVNPHAARLNYPKLVVYRSSGGERHQLSKPREYRRRRKPAPTIKNHNASHVFGRKAQHLSEITIERDQDAVFPLASLVELKIAAAPMPCCATVDTS
jgi:hypothetical protein